MRLLSELEFGARFADSDILEEWNKILQVNYWPIFDISRRILEQSSQLQSGEFIIDQLARTAQALVRARADALARLTGTVFQKLIADRKFLGCLLHHPLRPRSWSVWRSMKIACLAMTIGRILKRSNLCASPISPAAQEHFCPRLTSASANSMNFMAEIRRSIHPQMMERALVGCDILPAAAHLTASMLAGAHPTITYDESAIFTAALWYQEDGKVALGSIDLLRDMALLEGSEITAKAIEATRMSEVDIWRFAPHGSFDMVIMNPPFTRAESRRAHEYRIPPIPMFAAFGSSAAEQKAMANAAKELTKGTLAHGSAGEASTFLALADRKLKIDGMLALVMPVTLLTGSSWEKCRNQLRRLMTDSS